MIYLSVTLKCGKINVGKKTVTSSNSCVTDGVRDARMLLCSNARFTFPGSPNHHLLVNSCLHCVAAVEGKGSRTQWVLQNTASYVVSLTLTPHAHQNPPQKQFTAQKTEVLFPILFAYANTCFTLMPSIYTLQQMQLQTNAFSF